MADLLRNAQGAGPGGASSADGRGSGFLETIRLLWRRWIIVVGVTALVVAASAAFLFNQKRVYEARATVAMLPVGDDPQLLPYYGQVVESVLPTYVQLVETDRFSNRVAATLPFDITGRQLREAVYVAPFAKVGLLHMVARSPSPSRARQMAQSTADAFVAELADNRIVALRVVDDAALPDAPVSPRRALVLSAALLVGALLGAAAALGWERTFGRIDDPEQLAAAARLPVLAVVPAKSRLRSMRKVFVGDPGLTDLEESVLGLRTNLLLRVRDGAPGLIVLTSLDRGAGTSTIAANLAVVVAELGYSTLLVDADVRSPAQHELFGVPNHRGVTSTVLDAIAPGSVLQPTSHSGLEVVAAGPRLASRTQEVSLYLHQLPRFGSLADVVLVDGPPVREGDDSRLLTADARAVVLVVRAGSHSPHHVHALVESLSAVGVNLIGAVLTMARRRVARKYATTERVWPEPAPSTPSHEVPAGSLERSAGRR